MSPTTATLNRLGLKRQALAELHHGLAPGCSLTLMGDGWTLRRRTGRQDVYGDVEELLEALAAPGADWTAVESPRAVVARVVRRVE
ncbi:hypothetical protein [Citricoccus sp.]|uniref:hypothetical protein n=1 Tax=Citricoccus sp. TaxID=1978372 RepID=UPI0028BF3D49|nr:hypothetical protein [Citricoccus sp.]